MFHIQINPSGEETLIASLIHLSVIYHLSNRILFGHKKKKIWPFTTIWMDHEDTMLNEIHQTKRKTYFPLYIEFKKAKSAREGEIMVARKLGSEERGKWGDVIQRIQTSSKKMSKS